METKANYTLIGLFTLAVVVGVFGFVWWFQSIGGSGERTAYQVVFDGSVSGLRTGGSVLFNGIRVGEVSRLALNPEHPEQVVATVSIDKAVKLHEDTRVGLEFAGLTGIASISLKGGTASSPALVGSTTNPPMLAAAPGTSQDVTQGARDTLRRLDEFLMENQKAFHSTLANLDKFSGALARNSDRIDKITTGLQSLAGGEDGKSGELVDAARSIRELIDNLDKRTAEIAKGVSAMTSAGTKQINAVGSDAHRMMAEIEKSVKNIERNPSTLIFGGSAAPKAAAGAAAPKPTR
jgi:phospholipid/cholesterol/gamma-HCH transport system substrate-binding protein